MACLVRRWWCCARCCVHASDPPFYLPGRGTLGRVFLAKNKRNGLYYAIKRISKTEICRRKNIKGVLAEIDILRACNHPFIVHLYVPCGLHHARSPAHQDMGAGMRRSKTIVSFILC